MTLYLLCMDPSHDPLVISQFGEKGGFPWTPARRRVSALEYRCPLCGGGPWRFGVGRMRTLTEAATKGEVSGAVDISKLA
jgi:hypothetical protein